MLFQKYLAFICQGSCGKSMVCCIFITEFIREICEHLGPCSPHICKETVIQTELRKLVLRNKEQLLQNVKDETILVTFCEIPLVFYLIPCMGLSFLVFQVNALFICFSLLPCSVSVFRCPLEDLNPLSLTLPPVSDPFLVLLI